MTLQTRVAILEKDVATLRSRADNADVERDKTNKKLADSRAETHGWAQLTVRIDRKLDAAAELLQLIYADVRQTKETLAEHGEMLAEHGKRFDEVDKTLAEHGKVLAEHGKVLAEHGKVLAEHGRVLAEHGKRFDRVDEMLRQILAKVS